jgi:hypothetical protein
VTDRGLEQSSEYPTMKKPRSHCDRGKDSRSREASRRQGSHLPSEDKPEIVIRVARVPDRYPGWHTMIGELHFRLGRHAAAEFLARSTSLDDCPRRSRIFVSPPRRLPARWRQAGSVSGVSVRGYLLHISPVAPAPGSRKNTKSHGTLTASSL